MGRKLSLFLALVLFLPQAVFASECDDNPGYYFCSDWETATGSTNAAIMDGGLWADYNYSPNLEVVNNQPSGGPETGNALAINWAQYYAGDCSNGANNYVELFPSSLPNPYYARVYFYSGDPREYTACGGRKFMYFKNMNGYAVGGGLYLYAADGDAVRLHVKNHVNENGTNHRDSEHLDGSADWPDKVSEGLINANTWYSIEFAVYTHDTNGWIKVWLDGDLVINATPAAFDSFGDAGSGYDTNTGYVTNWLQIPSFRNGGCLTAHTEYFDNMVIDDAYIGPLAEEADPGSTGGSGVELHGVSKITVTP